MASIIAIDTLSDCRNSFFFLFLFAILTRWTVLYNQYIVCLLGVSNQKLCNLYFLAFVRIVPYLVSFNEALVLAFKRCTKQEGLSSHSYTLFMGGGREEAGSPHSLSTAHAKREQQKQLHDTAEKKNHIKTMPWHYAERSGHITRDKGVLNL